MKVVEGNGAQAVGRHPSPTFVKLLRHAHAWRAKLEEDNPQPISHLAEANGVNSSYFTRILRLAYLAPDITEAILDGRQPADLTVARLLDNHDFPLGWPAQRLRLGFPTPEVVLRNLATETQGPIPQLAPRSRAQDYRNNIGTTS